MIFNPTDAPVGVPGLDYVEWTDPASRFTVRIPIRAVGMSPRRDTLTPADLAHIRYGVANVYRETFWADLAIGIPAAKTAAARRTEPADSPNRPLRGLGEA